MVTVVFYYDCFLLLRLLFPCYFLHYFLLFTCNLRLVCINMIVPLDRPLPFYPNIRVILMVLFQPANTMSSPAGVAVCQRRRSPEHAGVDVDFVGFF